jgi:hypothetical protein
VRALVVAGTGWMLAACWSGLDAQSARGRTETPAPVISLFAHSKDCQACHNNLQSPSGENVSIGSAWRATMMANSARDPYWQASVRRETLEHPSHSGAIQDECGGCHMPMSTHAARAGSGRGAVFAHLPITDSPARPLAGLAADGVSCTVCHQLPADGLGTRERVSGHFTVTAPLPGGIRRIYGPYDIDPGRRTVMRSVTGYEQVQAPHVQESRLCASCHTLITTALGPNGEVVGTLPEQMNFEEWEHSAFPAEQKSCQSCHMPRVAGPVRISSVLGEERETLARHTFVGGNAQMLRILSRYRDDLGVVAPAEELDATAAATVHQLQHDTAEVSISSPRVEDGLLGFDVELRNLTGHKFPTGYPARRAWLHVVVADSRGEVVFESGAPHRDGSISGNDSDDSHLAFEPHHALITLPEQVQIYESILGDRTGSPTTGLLTATQYLKDNRLLPRGFDKRSAPAEIGVYGGALGDASFTGGSDVVRYAIRVPDGGGYTVSATLRYQAIGFRWASNLERFDAPEPRRFLSYYRETAPDSSVVVATATVRSAP